MIDRRRLLFTAAAGAGLAASGQFWPSPVRTPPRPPSKA
ncbi:twin-arginine translocation signal domain-containing protein [Brevundimonas denitrificans]